MYVLDANAIIYHLAGEDKIRSFVAEAEERQALFYVPTIVRLELFSKPDITATERAAILEFLAECRYIHLDTFVADYAADVRRTYKLKTPDSIIAASALYTGSTLVTRNARDFARVRGLFVEAI